MEGVPNSYGWSRYNLEVGAFLHHTGSDHISLSMSRKIHRKSIGLDIADLRSWRKRDKPTGPPPVKPPKNPQGQNAIHLFLQLTQAPEG